MRKEKLDFFRSKVFCEDESSPYHYVHFYKNTFSKHIDEEPFSLVYFSHPYYNTSKDAYLQCLYEYKLKKKVKEIETTLL